MLDTVLEIARYSLPVLAVAVLALCLSALLKRARRRSVRQGSSTRQTAIPSRS